MENEKIGRFICALRKEKGMTQKELAEQLGITDKAVSKWERGLSCPDISLLSSLSGLLGVSVGELLGDERGDPPAQEAKADIDRAPRFAQKEADSRCRNWRRAVSLSFSLLLLTGAAVCSICDMAKSGMFSWSLYPIASAFFAWLVLFPLLWLGGRGICPSLIALSLTVLPFLAILDRLIRDVRILPVGIRMAALSLGFLWAVFALFRLLKSRWLAAALALLLMIVLCVLINLSLSALLGGAVIDVWDILVIGLLAVLAAGCFALHIWKGNRKALL